MLMSEDKKSYQKTLCEKDLLKKQKASVLGMH